LCETGVRQPSGNAQQSGEQGTRWYQPAATPVVINALVITINVPISKTAGMKKADRNIVFSGRKFMTKNLTNKGFLYLGFESLNSQGSLTFG
jgi:hypothetical protein